MAVNAAIFYLTQNNDVRKTYLKTSLYFLFKNFNATHKYPVVIFHEGDFDATAQTEILMGIRASCRSCVSFRAVDVDDFKVPDNIDKDKLKRCIATKPTPYWRNEKYRLMCRWWMVHMPRYAAGYDYIMRLDDDSIIEEPIPDIFEWSKNKDLVYASNIMHTDCGMCCYGMKEFFEKHCPSKIQQIQKLFIANEMPSRAVQVHPFRTLLSITQTPLPEIGEKIKLHMPIMYYNNFHITKSSFWQREDVKKLIDEIDKDGSIFYFRWGDAPLQSLIVMLLAEPHQVKRSIFQYSKRMQREGFYGDDKQFHAYMPDTYDKTSCITQQNNDTKTKK